MVRSSWMQALLCAASLATAKTTSQADGLTATATSRTATVGTVTIDGKASTYSVAFTVPAEADVGPNILPNIYDSKAKNAQALCPGYKASNVKNTTTGLTASLSLAGSACNVYGTDVKDLSLSIQVQSSNRLNVQIQPTYLSSKNESWYVLPSELVPKPASNGSAQNVKEIDLEFSWTNNPTFGFTVKRKSTGDTIFDTTGSVLVYEDQFIEFVTQLPQDYNLYGMGERIHGLRLGNNFTATFWAADAGDPIDRNIYGNHPFYLDTRYYAVDNSTGKRKLVTDQDISATGSYESYSHGVFQRNAHGMEALMLPTNLTWRALGGSIDLYFFDGPDQPSVTQQYQEEAIGLPVMQQYWSFGFHQCRWGYANWSEVEAVVNNYRAFDIPLETIWNDIDWMFQYRDFENDPIRYPYDEGEAFLARLSANNQHYVPIIDSALYIPNPNNASDAYPVYDEGHEADAFLHNPDGSEYIGSVWPGYTVFPDWMSSGAGEWWAQQLIKHHNRIDYSGIWIDMSEASSFCIGSCGSGNLSLNPVHPPFLLPGEPGAVIYTYPEGFNLTNATEAKIAASLSASQASSVAKATPPATTTIPYFTPSVTPNARNVINPPYVINNVNGALGVHAVSPNATHQNGVEEYDVHNLWGYQILNATYYGLAQVFPGKRPFIIGRSTFAGSGRSAGHWGGDNTSLFAYMYFSISQALNFALFGIPMFGVDTCGFNGNSDEELCNRWMQLSAFFPFYRNHNTLTANSQEAYVWESVIVASKRAMQIRYSLLPYIYTLFYQAHTTGSTVMRALAWEFPSDPTLRDLDNQFLLGPSLMVVPVLGQGETTVKGYFPGTAQGTVWYDWYTQEAVSVKSGENKTISAPLGHIPVYLRGGSILPQQEALYTTAESRNSPWSLLCTLDKSGSATGQLYVDDGVSIVPSSTLIVDFTAKSGSLSAKVSGSYADTNPLANVTVMGVQSKPSKVSLNGQQLNSSMSYDSSSKVLSLKGLQSATGSGAWAQDWTLSWS